MKVILLNILLLFTFTAWAQDSTDYSFLTRPGWGKDRLVLPPSFAPTINLHGVEEMRFSPGWAKKESEEYWSYVFVWKSDSVPLVLDTDALLNYLTAYYDGLYLSKTHYKTPSGKKSFSKLQGAVNLKLPQDVDLLKASAEFAFETYDYMTQKRIVFNIKVLRKRMPGKMALIFEVSPKAYSNLVWKDLDSVAEDFNLL